MEDNDVITQSAGLRRYITKPERICLYANKGIIRRNDRCHIFGSEPTAVPQLKTETDSFAVVCRAVSVAVAVINLIRAERDVRSYRLHHGDGSDVRNSVPCCDSEDHGVHLIRIAVEVQHSNARFIGDAGAEDDPAHRERYKGVSNRCGDREGGRSRCDYAGMGDFKPGRRRRPDRQSAVAEEIVFFDHGYSLTSALIRLQCAQRTG